jgi:adenine phosphoribosyltransferase
MSNPATSPESAASQTLSTSADCDRLKKLIREVPDFPKPGILFYDITTLLKDKLGFARLIDALSENYIGKEIDLVLGMEARGFIFGPALAYRLNAGFVPVRKPGKLPAETIKISYELEYGSNALELHKDAIERGQRILIVDDLLATGGTARATADLATALGAKIAGLAFVVELDFLNGREKLAGYDVFSLLHYDH